MSVICNRGHSHPGANGGAGVLVYRYRDTGDVEVFLGLRTLSPTGEKISWANFGGMIEEGETAQDAALRELYEETGLKVEDLRLRAITKDDHGGWKYTTFYATPTRDITDADIKLDKTAHSEAAWFSRDELWRGSPRFKGHPLHEGFQFSAVPNLGVLLPPNIDPITGSITATLPSPSYFGKDTVSGTPSSGTSNSETTSSSEPDSTSGSVVQPDAPKPDIQPDSEEEGGDTGLLEPGGSNNSLTSGSSVPGTNPSFWAF
ncbi:NUDIX hydrolase domain-like protein [Hypoxylon sp. FL1150]|nr:NUDIX hydrolase domain-like protein [Hypoxylon sp. FL1150]